MNWNTIINHKDFSWHTKTDEVNVPTPYELSRCIFDISEDSLNDLFLFIESNLGIRPGESIAEFGCGNGANLLYFKQKFQSDVSGIDISYRLIDFCKRLFPDRDKFFLHDIKKLESKSVDYFICNSVFQYLPTCEDAFDIILEMKRVARKSILITDIKNIMFKDKFQDTQMSRQKLTREEFDNKYKTTPHLFFYKKQFNETTDMPTTYPDSEFGSFSTLIKL